MGHHKIQKENKLLVQPWPIRTPAPCASLTIMVTLCSSFKFPNQVSWISNLQISPCQKKRFLKSFNFSRLHTRLNSLLSITIVYKFTRQFLALQIYSHSQQSISSTNKRNHPFSEGKGKTYRKHTYVWQVHQSQASQYKTPPQNP